ncbi:hypothetical protein [Cupriavidus pinatubonensis]|uniref:hypothetical protein n=1 Tax=Cupriavidus pinatubonensis TaxID=248026 RepID=UPI0011276061|nr:hypothetical protein [Cupriavidus pinatubonensis]TPQ43213.1 hypothetical protein C2U69_03550 [Cupriavidus pinatubonensis]
MKTTYTLVLAALMATIAGCNTAPPAPQVMPLNATIKLGRVTEKTFLTRVDVATDGGGYGNYGGVGVGAVGGSGGGGGGVGVGFSFDLSRLFNRPPPPQQIDLFQYKVRTIDGTMASVNAPAAPGLEPGACVRLIYVDGSSDARLAPSNEC